jgi:hypothetical protein
MKKYAFLLFVFILLTLVSCKGKQIGCICEDGWRSYSMGGPGTCSHHGGVAYKLYESDLKND